LHKRDGRAEARQRARELRKTRLRISKQSWNQCDSIRRFCR